MIRDSLPTPNEMRLLGPGEQSQVAVMVVVRMISTAAMISLAKMRSSLTVA